MPTQYYNLPTISQSAVANIPDDMNGLATAVDFALHQVAGNVPDVGTLTVQVNTAQQTATNALSLATTNEQDIASAEADIVEVKSNIQTLQGNVATISNTATNAQVTASSAQQGVTALNAGLQEFEQMFNLSNINAISTLPNVSGFSRLALTLAQNSAGSIFKLYGQFVKDNSNTINMNKSAIPGGRDNYAYGVPTGLFLNKAPNEAYAITGCHSVTTWSRSSGAVTGVDFGHIAVGTNGQIYLYPESTSGAKTYSSSDGLNAIYIPCVYFNGSFGDTPIISPER